MAVRRLGTWWWRFAALMRRCCLTQRRAATGARACGASLAAARSAAARSRTLRLRGLSNDAARRIKIVGAGGGATRARDGPTVPIQSDVGTGPAIDSLELNGAAGVRTLSEGSGDHRQLVIYPANNTNKRSFRRFVVSRSKAPRHRAKTREVSILLLCSPFSLR